MQLTLESKQLEILREILTSTVAQLRNESARTDAHDFREMLHDRERVVESILEKVSQAS